MQLQRQLEQLPGQFRRRRLTNLLAQMSNEVQETSNLDSSLTEEQNQNVGGASETTTPQSASTTRDYEGPERRKEIEDLVDLDDIDYFPMFSSSLQAAALTLISQFLIPMYLSLQLNIDVELRLWARVLPYFAIRTDAETFHNIVYWSALGTAVILAAFSILAFLPRRSLRVRFGRLFAWLDISLMALLLLYRHEILQVSEKQEPWMWIMLIVGLVGFINGSLIVRMQYKDRLEELNG